MKEHIFKLLEELRAKSKEPETLRIMEELQDNFLSLDNEFQKLRQVDLDEIRILRELAGARPEQSNFQYLKQEKELVSVRRELEECKQKLKTLVEERFQLQRENEQFQRISDELVRESAKEGGKWVWNVKSLEHEKKLLSDEVQKMQTQLRALSAEVTISTRDLQKKSEQEKQELQNHLVNQMYTLLAEQKQQIAGEERLLLQGLYTYIQNRIGGVFGSAQMLLDRIEAFRNQKGEKKIGDELTFFEKIFQENLENVRKLQKGLSDFVLFTKMNEPQFQRTNLIELVEHVLTTKQNLLKAARIEIKRNWMEMPSVAVDRDQVQLVFSEVIENAVDAQPKGGEIEFIFSHDLPNSYVQMVVRDRGTGIQPHLHQKIFQPFFTTKENHSGLGLTRCLRLLSMNQSSIETKSSPAGAEIIMKFPVSQS